MFDHVEIHNMNTIYIRDVSDSEFVYDVESYDDFVTTIDDATYVVEKMFRKHIDAPYSYFSFEIDNKPYILETSMFGENYCDLNELKVDEMLDNQKYDVVYLKTSNDNVVIVPSHLSADIAMCLDGDVYEYTSDNALNREFEKSISDLEHSINDTIL